MIAETVFNVFQALTPEEKKRFYRMCGMVPAAPKKKLKLLSDGEATEYLIKKLGR